MLTTLSWILLVAGAIVLVAGFVTYRRRGEAEVSGSMAGTPTFKIGAIMMIIAVIIKIILAVS